MIFSQTASVQAIGEELVRATLDRFGPRGLAADKFSLTLVLHPDDPSGGNGKLMLPRYAYRGGEQFYPCSVVKMFYLVAAQAALEAGRIVDTPELDRASRDMITWSSNTATNYIIDLVTGTTGDMELSPSEMEQWVRARNGVNRYFQTLEIDDFRGINVNQKLMDDDRYGREKAFVQIGGNNHNRLSTNAAAALLAMIMEDEMISPARSRIMANYLSRSREKAFIEMPGAQVLNYLGAELPQGARIWSKAGWTTWTRDPLASYRRHDAIHVALPEGRRFTLVAFTEGKEISADPTSMPFIGKLAAERIRA
jgi:beta-lactamase class A